MFIRGGGERDKSHSGFIMSDKSLGLISIINNVVTPAVLSLRRPERRRRRRTPA